MQIFVVIDLREQIFIRFHCNTPRRPDMLFTSIQKILGVPEPSLFFASVGEGTDPFITSALAVPPWDYGIWRGGKARAGPSRRSGTNASSSGSGRTRRPRTSCRCCHRAAVTNDLYPYAYRWMDFIHAPSILPISTSCPLHTSYFLKGRNRNSCESLK